MGSFTGDPAQAFWYFDGELAKAAEAYQKRHRGKPVLLGLVQDGGVVPQVNGTHQQVTLNFLPEVDGVTFKLNGAFLDTVPDGRPKRWTGKNTGDPIEAPQGGPPIGIHRITGPVRQLSADTWQLEFNRTSFLGDRRGNESWFAAIWPGDGTSKRAVQQAMMRIPARLNDGKPQKITFDPPPSIPRDTKMLKLVANSDSGLPVRYYVREGPAEIDGDVLRLTDIPPRAKFPIKVTVVAWQFGTRGDQQVQSADPVIRTMEIVR